MDRCPHCMTHTTAQVCPACGKTTYWQAPGGQLPVGTLLRSGDGRIYQLGAAKGQGGFGITYAAMDLQSNIRVAVKEYFPGHCAGRDTMTRVICSTGHMDSFRNGLDRFLQEARMLFSVGALDSVVGIRDFFEANGTAYIVMEYIDGDALHHVVAARGPMHKQELFPILQPLLRDLAILHDAGVIHRDISPDNLILTREGKLKLLDFGAARSTSGNRAMTVMLKPGFSPLEQHQAKSQGPYTDVYAMAGTIYYCLTGRVPPAAMERVQEDRLLLPNDLGAGLTQREQDALVWGLNLRAERRPQNINAFATALLSVPAVRQSGHEVISQTGQQGGHAAQDISRTGQQTGAVAQDSRPSGKRPGKGLFIGIGAAAAAVLLLVGVLIGTALGKKGSDDGPTEPPEVYDGGSETNDADTLPPTEPDKTSEDGFSYRIVNGEAVITGYDHEDAFVVFPDELEGHTVTVVGEGCMAGNTTVESILLPIGCTEIRANAFSGCIRLSSIDCYSSPMAAPTAFSGCTRLRVIMLSGDESVDSWLLPAGCKVIGRGMETGRGPLTSAALDAEGVIYGITDSGEAVILDVPAGITELKVPEKVSGCPVVWMRKDALENAAEDLTVYMCPEMGFDYSLLEQAEWDCASTDDFCFSWYLTCTFCRDINLERSGADPIKPGWRTVHAATIRAKEISTNYSYTRDDGTSWKAVLDELGVRREYQRTTNRKVDTRAADYDAKLDETIGILVERYSKVHDEESNAYYTGLGVAMYKGDDGYLYINIIGIA